MNNEHINPDHYKSGSIEMIDILKNKLTYEEFKGFLKGVILQYIIRSDMKNGYEDIVKAKWYLEVLLNVYSEHLSSK